MSKYSDVPMDYADARLVSVGETLGIRNVLTLDRRGFSVYRYASRGGVRIFPDQQEEAASDIAKRRSNM